MVSRCVRQKARVIVMNDNPSDDVGVGVIEYGNRGGGRSEGQFFVPIDVHKHSMVDPRTRLVQHFPSK